MQEAAPVEAALQHASLRKFAELGLHQRKEVLCRWQGYQHCSRQACLAAARKGCMQHCAVQRLSRVHCLALTLLLPPLVGALQGMQQDRAPCCHSNTPPFNAVAVQWVEQGRHSAGLLYRQYGTCLRTYPKVDLDNVRQNQTREASVIKNLLQRYDSSGNHAGLTGAWQAFASGSRRASRALRKPGMLGCVTRM